MIRYMLDCGAPLPPQISRAKGSLDDLRKSIADENVIRMNITNSVSEIGEILPRAELAAKRQRSPLGGSCGVPHDSVVAVVERTQRRCTDRRRGVGGTFRTRERR